VAGAAGRLFIGIVSLFFFIKTSRFEIRRRLGYRILLLELLLGLELAAVGVLALSDREWLSFKGFRFKVLIVFFAVEEGISFDLVLHAGDATCFKHRITHYY
jgi:hypothetical protein